MPDMKQSKDTTTTSKDSALTTSIKHSNKTSKSKNSYEGLRRLANLVDTYTENLPVNNNNNVLAYIDPSILLEAIVDSDVPDDRSIKNNRSDKSHLTAETNLQLLEDATVPLDYSEGFPTANAEPFWQRLDCEPLKYYKLFKHYRNQIKYKATRSFGITSEELEVPNQLIKLVSNIYQWNYRLQAFDQYRELKKNAQRKRKIEEMENEHHSTAKMVFKMCKEFIQNNQDKMSPNTALKWFKYAAQLQRLSVGLNPDDPSDPNKPNSLSQTLVVNNNEKSKGNKSSSGGMMDSEEKEKLQTVIDVLKNAGALDPEQEQQEQAQKQEQQKQRKPYDLDEINFTGDRGNMK